MELPHQPIWTLPVAAVYESLATTTDGLADRETIQRLAKFGANELGIGVECLALFAFIYVPFFSDVFGTAPLSSWQWLLLLVCPPILLGAEELRKTIGTRR